MTIKTIDDLRSAFRKKDTSQGNFYQFHKMPMDSTAVVRFLPDKNPDNPLGFVVRKTVHILELNEDDRKVVPCVYAMFGEKCPICDVSQAYYKAGDKPNGKRYWKKEQHIAQILVLKDPIAPDSETGENNEGKIVYINLGFQLFGVVKSEFEGGDLDCIPYFFKGGYNFHIAKNQQGEHPTYALGSKFARKQSDLTDEQIAFVEENWVDLSTLLPNKPDMDEVNKMLNCSITGEEYVTSSSPQNETASFAESIAAAKAKEEAKTSKPKPNLPDLGTPDEPPFEPDVPEVKTSVALPVEEAPTTQAAETVAAVAATEVTTGGDDGLDDEAEEILSKIRNRRKQKLEE